MSLHDLDSDIGRKHETDCQVYVIFFLQQYEYQLSAYVSVYSVW